VIFDLLLRQTGMSIPHGKDLQLEIGLLPSPPSSADGVITIKSPHNVTISASGLSIDQVVVDAGGQVTVAATITSSKLANGPELI
jgi:hypothetical protein